MKALLVRVGIDSSERSGGRIAPVDPETGKFAYVPILETGNESGKPIRPGYETTYEQFKTPCEKFGKEHKLPRKFDDLYAHLDPDFIYRTYGDAGNKGAQLNNQNLVEDDILAFYAGLKPPNAGPGKLVYALIGLYRLADKPRRALDISQADWNKNAHTRREPKKDDIVLLGKPNVSGRLERCITIGEYHPGEYHHGGHYFLESEIQKKWGEPESIYLYGPHRALRHPEKFYEWFNSYINKHNIKLVERNN